MSSKVFNSGCPRFSVFLFSVCSPQSLYIRVGVQGVPFSLPSSPFLPSPAPILSPFSFLSPPPFLAVPPSHPSCTAHHTRAPDNFSGNWVFHSNVLTTLIIGIIMGNKRFDTWLIQIIGPIYDPQSVFFRTEKKSVLCKLNRFYKLKIGFTNLKSVWTGKKSVFCNPVLPYPIPSYQIPSLPHPTRILNTILHLYKILLPYPTLSYHIEIEPNPPMAETSRIGTPSKFTQAEKSRPKWHKLCCLHNQNAEIIWTGLQSHSSAKKRFFFFGANLRENRKQSTLH